ncbi:PREDICTED: uncharacterized protein LOC107072181 isoform X3 [Polistes dominula]|uniref:Uncharacterized protein LOC107072181 isoform X3 n=1 Tax=Polistes dominula TaxID=743375 RepID=A0ABM1J4M9_POLDO|nr:PREDICTED: uncharacterized protein LOC107072181 isoform X3 [Polistes dominula]
MPTVSETLIKHRIKNVIRRFKFQELEDAVLPVFPETTWKRLRSQLVKQHEQFITANVVCVLEKIMNDNNLKEKELERRLMRLELIDKKVLQGFVDAITQSMGYNKNKSLDLNGRNLMSLMRLLRIRKQGAVSLLDIMNKPMYKNAKPIIRKTGIDFTQERQRRKFLENRFGVDPPTLDTLVIKEANTSIYDREIASRLPNNTIKIGWQFRSENIAIFLINLFERGILLPPLPSYISNLMFMGRNTLTLEESQYCNN